MVSTCLMASRLGGWIPCMKSVGGGCPLHKFPRVGKGTVLGVGSWPLGATNML